MNSKERVITALEHREPDRVPIDGIIPPWSTPFLKRILLPHFGLCWTSGERWSDSGVDMLIEKLGMDARLAPLEPPIEFRNKAIYDPLFDVEPWGVQVKTGALMDEWGVVRELNSTRTGVGIISHPLKGKDSLDGYQFPDPNAPSRFDGTEKYIKKWGDQYAIAGHFGIDYLFMRAWELRGYNDFMVDLCCHPKFVNELLDRLQNYFVAIEKQMLEMPIDIFIFGDDIGMQNGMAISPTIWRMYFKPRFKEVIDTAKRKNVFVMFHSDGVIDPIVPDLVEMGLDILNPIQPECMNPAQIKNTYGDRLTLSGTISVQNTLPHGTVEDVRNEVIERIRTCGNRGGFMICPSNAALLDTPVQNFLTVYDTVRKYGHYPLG